MGTRCRPDRKLEKLLLRLAEQRESEWKLAKELLTCSDYACDELIANNTAGACIETAGNDFMCTGFHCTASSQEKPEWSAAFSKRVRAMQRDVAQAFIKARRGPEVPQWLGRFTELGWNKDPEEESQKPDQVPENGDEEGGEEEEREVDEVLKEEDEDTMRKAMRKRVGDW